MNIFVYLNHKNGALEDSNFELLALGKKINPSAKITGILFGDKIDELANLAAKSFKEIIKIQGASFSYPNAEIIRAALLKIVPDNSIVLMEHNTFSMDLAPGLSIKKDFSFASDIIAFEGIENNALKIARQEFGGAVYVKNLCDISKGIVVSVRSGAFVADTNSSEQGQVIDKSNEIGEISSKRKFLEVIEAEKGDVDITKSEVLVSIGRGIEEEGNIDLARDLAKAMNAELSCSRPIVDAKWLEKSRQVGTSGQTVKPKVYLALGISGSFQHLGGIKGKPFIVAVNKNPKAPIFSVADVGIVTNMVDFMPILTEQIKK